MSAWLDIVCGGDNFRTPALQEFHQPYKTCDKQQHEHVQLLMLVCGRNCGVAGANRQIRSCRFGNTILLDCHLHHHRDSYPSIKAGRCAPNLTRHIINDSQNVSPMELAHQFYARALSPISGAVVFMQNEYWDIPAIVCVLARWVNLSFAPSIRSRPQVLIVSEHEPKSSSKDIERDLAAELMLRHNPLRELSYAQAEKTWRSCFSGIRLLYGSRTQTSSDHVLEWTDAIRNNDAVVQFRNSDIKQLLRSSCVQFAGDHTKTFSFQRAWRMSPVPARLATGVETLVRLTMHSAALYEAACHTVANALVIETYQHRRNFSQRYDAALSDPSFADWFEEFYSSILGSIEPLTLKSDVKSLFLQFIKNRYLQREPLMSEPQILLSEKEIMLRIDLCILCLCRTPANTLSCGHILCDSCMRMNSRQDEGYGETYEMEKCVLCGSTNSVQVKVQPLMAGIRILNLHGNIDDALPMAMYLKDLRSSLSGHFEEYFDLVTGSGIGAFFMIMIFCNQASIDDCIHHMSSLKCVKIDGKGLYFGKGLTFPRSDLRHAKIKLVLHNSERRLESCKNYIVKSSKWLQRSPTPCQDVEVGGRCNTEAHRLWPNNPVRIITQCPNNKYSETLSEANELISALFYVQREDIPTFYSLSPVSFVIWIKCRLPVSQHLLDIAMRLHRRKIRAQVHEQGYQKAFVMCTDQVCEALKKGRPFLRRLEVPLSSPKSLVTVTLDGTLAAGTSVLCCCPADIIPCVDANDRPKISLKEQIHVLQETLARLI